MSLIVFYKTVHGVSGTTQRQRMKVTHFDIARYNEI